MAPASTVPVDGHRVGVHRFGKLGGWPVVWCHGGPGNKLQTPAALESAAALNLRLIGIDRPGYGQSTLEPDRSLADWAPIAAAVADALGIHKFLVVGVSTGGPYAIALAALYPEVQPCKDGGEGAGRTDGKRTTASSGAKIKDAQVLGSPWPMKPDPAWIQERLALIAAPVEQRLRG